MNPSEQEMIQKWLNRKPCKSRFHGHRHVADSKPNRSRREKFWLLRRRSQHAARRLTWDIASNHLLSPATIVLLDCLIRTPDIETASISELAARCGISKRAVQYAVKALIDRGLLIRHERRLSADRNDTNVWELCGLALSAAKSIRGVGAKACGAKEEYNYKPLHTSLTLPKSEKSDCKITRRKLASSVRKKSKGLKGAASRPSTASPETPRPEPDNPALLKLAIQASSHFFHRSEPPKSATDIWEIAEDKLDLDIPLFPRIWQYGLRKHGFSAALAVIETAILHEAGHVRHPAAFLAGILKKPPVNQTQSPDDACAPHVTLSRIMAARSGAARRITS